MRPESKTSNGSIRIVPPDSVMRAAVASASSVAMYVVQWGGMASLPGGGGLAAETDLPPFVNIV